MLVIFCLREVQQLGPSPRPEGRHQQLESSVHRISQDNSLQFQQAVVKCVFSSLHRCINKGEWSY